MSFYQNLLQPFNDVKKVPLPAASSAPSSGCDTPATDPPPTEFIEIDEAMEDDIAVGGGATGVEAFEPKLPVKAC